jgi:hypothetical protein
VTAAEEELIAVDNRVGSSMTSLTLSTFLLSNIALFLLSSTAFSEFLSYLVAKLVAADSKTGNASSNSFDCMYSEGIRVERFERWSVAVMTERCERLDSACKERRLDWVAALRYEGSVVVKDCSERVGNRAR